MISATPTDIVDPDSSEAIAWHHRVANHRLGSGMLPAPQATDEQLLHFAGTFDGYLVRPTMLPDFIARFQAAYERGERPALGLTAARTVLFAYSRWHHMTSWEGSLPDTWRPSLHWLAEIIRAHVARREAGVPLPTGTLAAVQDGVMDAYERLVEGYAKWGGYRWHGWTDFPDSHNYQGPVVWSEADASLRFAMELERQFPHAVHMELAIGKATRLDYDPDIERRQRVDLVVSDMSSFVEDETSQTRFQTLTHQAFIETKWLVKGWRGNRFEQDAIKRAASVWADTAKLTRHLQLGRCQVAAVLVIDDENYFSEHSPPDAPPAVDAEADEVWRLVVGPRALRDRGMLLAGDQAPATESPFGS